MVAEVTFLSKNYWQKKKTQTESPGYNERLFSTEDNLFPSKQMYGKEMVSANSYFLVIHHKEIKSDRKHLSTPYLCVVRKKERSSYSMKTARREVISARLERAAGRLNLLLYQLSYETIV